MEPGASKQPQPNEQRAADQRGGAADRKDEAREAEHRPTGGSATGSCQDERGGAEDQGRQPQRGGRNRIAARPRDDGQEPEHRQSAADQREQDGGDPGEAHVGEQRQRGGGHQDPQDEKARSTKERQQAELSEVGGRPIRSGVVARADGDALDDQRHPHDEDRDSQDRDREGGDRAELPDVLGCQRVHAPAGGIQGRSRTASLARAGPADLGGGHRPRIVGDRRQERPPRGLAVFASLASRMTLPISDADARFERSIDRWFRDRLRLEPTLASFVGVHEHDHRLQGASRESIEERVDFWRAAMAEMDRFSADDLTPSHALDRDLLVHEARLELHELTERRTWAGRSNAGGEIGDALFPLFSRDFAPFPERLERITDRLEAAPRLLGEARSRLTDPVALWIQIDLESGESLPSFLDVIVAAARSERCPEALLSRLDAAVNATRAALDDHDAWLRDEVLPGASADWRAGPEQFEEIVRLRELTAAGDEILAVGEQILADERAARAATSQELDPTLSPEEVADLVKDDHPASFGEALEEYRRSMAAARRFVIDHDLATMPADDTLVVIETPSYLRHLIPFAAYYDP